jgi:ADP-ribose pyrophosphatase
MKIVATETLVKTKFLDFNATEYTDTKGKTGFWTWCSRPNVKDIVVIVPMLRHTIWGGTAGDSSKDRLVVIKEFRVPLNDYLYSFPAGLVDSNETIGEAIIRELKEESGLDVSRIISFSEPVYNSAGLSDESIRIAFVDVTGEISNKNQEASEEIEIFQVNQEEAKKLLENTNNKFDAKTWLILKKFSSDGSIFV